MTPSAKPAAADEAGRQPTDARTPTIGHVSFSRGDIFYTVGRLLAARSDDILFCCLTLRNTLVIMHVLLQYVYHALQGSCSMKSWAGGGAPT